MVRKNTQDEEEFCPPSQSASRHRPRVWAGKRTSTVRKALLTNQKRKEATAPATLDDDINASYYNDFRQHVIEVRDYLTGKWKEGDNTIENDDKPEHDQQDEEQDQQDDDEDSGSRDSEEENIETPDLEDDSDDDDGLLPHNPFFQPHWTDEEKDAFFHAVAVHSRLRPDLIAASVKTKTMLDVSLYMRSLEDAIAELKAQELESDLSGGSDSEENEDETPAVGSSKKLLQRSQPRAFESDAAKKARRDAKLEASALERRAKAPCAHEMGIPWVDFEERLSRSICTLEDDDTRKEAGLNLARLRSLGPQKQTRTTKATPTPTRTKRDAKGKGRALDPDSDSDEGAQTSALPDASRPSEVWRTSNLYFVDGQLQILETILRDAEDARAAAELAEVEAAAATAGGATTSSRSNRGRSRSSSVAGSSTPSTSKAAQRQSTKLSQSNLASPSRSGGATEEGGGAERNLEDVSDVDSYILPQRRGSTSAAGTPADNSRSNSRSPSATRSTRGSATPAKTTRSSSTKPSRRGRPPAEDEEDVDDPEVCAKVRRRILNRLYMRKKRALAKGGEEAVEAVDTTTLRLKPGRRSKKQKAEEESKTKVGEKRKRGDDDVDDEDSEDEASESNDEHPDEKGRKVKGLKSKNASVRFKAEFEEAGLDDAELLASEGLGYFNLSMLGKLLNYLSSGYRDKTIQGTPAISASLIRVLFTTVVEFLIDVVRRSIVLAESRSTAHSRSKVFREAHRHITVDSVKMALEITGHPLEDRKAFLARLMQDENAPPPVRPQVIDAPVTTASLAGMTFRRSLWPPHIQLPREYRTNDDDEDEDEYTVRKKRRKSGYLEAVEEGWRVVRARTASVAGEDDMDVDEPDVEQAGEQEEQDPELLALCEDPILPATSSAAEERLYKKLMQEEAELDAMDTKRDKAVEQDIWDRILGDQVEE